ncbi:MAG: M15 family metallopeptidase [Thermoleophilia bacterium]
MTHTRRARHAPRRLRATLALIAVGVAAVMLGNRLAGSSPGAPLHASHGARAGGAGPLGEAGGAVPRGTTVFDGAVPGVARLNPPLLASLRRAAAQAAAGGVTLEVHSGWRSPAYQERLLREAVRKYGSVAAASRWVATPATSAHVSGDAVDIGPPGAATWLAVHGAAYGLCPVYGNEPWHFELRGDAVTHGCPETYADPTRDPRMRR